MLRYQIILDQSPEFQTLVTDLLALVKTYSLGIRITKVRLFVSAIRAAYDADLSHLAGISSQIPELTKLSKDRFDKSNEHHSVFIYPNHMDYVKAGLGRLAVEAGVRHDERSYIHLALRYFATLDRLQQGGIVKASDSLHPIEHRKRRPNNWRTLPEYKDAQD